MDLSLGGLKVHQRRADSLHMRAPRRKQLGVTLIEVMTAVACLALVSTSLVGGLSFASERMRMAEERGIVANRLRQVMEDLRASQDRSPNAHQAETWQEALEGVSSDVTFDSTLSVVTGKPGLQELSCQAVWNAVIGELSRPQTMTLRTFVLRDPPIPKVGTTLSVKGTNSFLHLDDPTNPKPVVIDLLAYGLTEGSTIELSTTGSYTSGPGITNSAIVGVFTRTNLCLGKGAASLSRVPDAVDAGAHVDTSSMGSGVNIPQDFPLSPVPIQVVVPNGARYLMLGVYDTLADNSGSLLVEVNPV